MWMLKIILFMLVFIGFGCWLLYGALSIRMKAKKAEGWPVVKGLILTSDVEEDRLRSATGTAVIAFLPKVKYQYIVDQKEYTGDRVIFGRKNYNYVTAAQISSLFSAGKEANVYYNPADPTDSVLAPKSREGVRSVIPGTFFIFSGIIVGVVALIFQ
jgi:Protein of unknown function (DUF3592)